MALLLFAILLGLAFVAATAWPLRVGLLVAIGVVPAAFWWSGAYRDNAGADWHPGTETLFITGVFAFVYWLLWVAAAVVGAMLGRTIRSLSRAARSRHG